MIIALAGRRVDALDASQKRFPPQNVDQVGESVRESLVRRIVLPFSRQKFRESSVVDRPGNWGTLYDTILDAVQLKGDLVVIDAGIEDPYSATNRSILEEAIALGQSGGESTGAVLLWDRVSRGANDYTDQFGAEARKRGLEVFEVSTI
jgi:hypothetical protein